MAKHLILVHGRGATAESMLDIPKALGVPGLEIHAPQAPGRTWYPNSFLAPVESNQPYLDNSLRILEETLAGLPSEDVALLGFSQGACLTLEFVARNPKRYAAVMALTGGLIGLHHHRGSLEGTPVFLGSSDPDPHVPVARVQETHRILTALGAQVEQRLYPGMPHTICQDEIEACRKLLKESA